MPTTQQLNLEASKMGGRTYDSARYVLERTVPAVAPKAKVKQGGSGQSSNRDIV